MRLLTAIEDPEVARRILGLASIGVRISVVVVYLTLGCASFQSHPPRPPVCQPARRMHEPRKDLRNLAIIAHVDHGKTTAGTQKPAPISEP